MSLPDEVTRAEFAKFAVSEACPMRFHAPDVDSWLDGNDRMAVIEDRYRWWAAGRSSLLSRVEAAEGALDDARIACADLCRARADAYHRESETLAGLEKVLVLSREAAALSCEHAILARHALRASGTREGE